MILAEIKKLSYAKSPESFKKDGCAFFFRNRVITKMVRAFLSSLNIGFYSEAEENAALINTVQKGSPPPLLNKVEKADFFKRLKSAK